MHILSFFLTLLLVAGPQSIIPRPVDYTTGQGQLVYSDNVQVKVKVADRKFIRETKDLPEWSKEGAYRLTIGKKGIEIVSVTETGAFYARQDLAQMRAVSDTLQYCVITDWPRFGYRGLMLDISRNYGDKEWIFKEMDAMALLKMNVLHIHLVDGAGWRIQIDSYPELTRKTAWRIGETYEEWTKSGGRDSEEGAPGASGGYLTKEDCREIVAHAAELHMEVIPEIEFPGHSNEALVAYPELACEDAAGNKVFNSDMCPSNPATYKFFESVIDEVIELFPSKMIHIGGDEASRSAWKNCPHCQALMKKEGFTNVAQLQSYMNHRMAEYLKSKGRRLLGWDEITHGGLPDDAVVMMRETEDGKKPTPHGHDIILTPDTHCYFNYPQDAPFKVPAAFATYLPLKVAYDFDPMEPWVKPEDRHHVLGVQCCLWTEYSPAGEYSEYLLYPRAFATAEIGWSPRERCSDYADFRERALVLLDTFKGMGYGTFDLANEYGDRYEATHPVRHLAVGKPVKYAEGHGWDTYWYPSTGETALTDGLFGTWSFKDRRWQRFYCDIDVTIDLEKVMPIHYIGATFLSQRIHSVAFPVKVEMFVSKDGKDFEKCGESTYRMRDEAQVTGDYMDFGAPVNVEARYVRFVAHRNPAPGHSALQIDEIVVN